MASANAREMSSCTGFDWYTFELERDLDPGVGIELTRPGVGMADGRGFAGVVMVKQQLQTKSLNWTRSSGT